MLIVFMKSYVGPYVRGGKVVSGYKGRDGKHVQTDHRQLTLFPSVSSPLPTQRDAAVAASAAASADDNRKFYVTMVREPGKQGQKVGWLAGPFDSEDEARGHVPQAKAAASKIDPFSDFDAFGVSSRTGASHPPGVLNAHLGIGADQEAVDSALRAHRPDGPVLDSLPRVPGGSAGKGPSYEGIWSVLTVGGRTAEALSVELEGDDRPEPAFAALKRALNGTKLELPRSKPERELILQALYELANTADAKAAKGRDPDDKKDAKAFSELATKVSRAG